MKQIDATRVARQIVKGTRWTTADIDIILDAMIDATMNKMNRVLIPRSLYP